jgi:endonuclease YncB( thermonuclease family)
VAKAIEQSRSGLTVGNAALGERGEGVGSVRQQVYDGDTITVRADGNFGVRFLGVDAPEKAIPLPGGNSFARLSGPEWDRFLRDPFANDYPPFEPALEEGLLAYLRERVGEGAAENHARHADAAEDALEAGILSDLEALGRSEEEFRFFLAFAYEVVDRYGRFLCYVNRRQESAEEPEPRPPSYNERLLAAGRVSPYFIWPNVNPFRRAGSVAEAVVPPGGAAEVADGDPTLRAAREGVKAAREAGLGVYGEDALRLEPFEVRYLARRRPPDRWLVDLSRTDDALLRPQGYREVAPEDRLFVPEEFVPLFVEAGWRREGS